ncbi:MAG TPA: cyanophycin synthetase [Mycobacteriales bacterium]|nr:cyanophycin synthetase [Mycobacteriales bacterium]
MSGSRPPAAPELTLRSSKVYRGPNIWSYAPAVHLVVDLGVLEHWPSNELPGFVDGLLEAVPAVAEHSCSRNKKGGFLERLREGTWLGHVAEHVAIQLQRATGADVGRGKTRGTGEPGVYNVIYAYSDETVGLAAGKLAVRLVNHLVEASPGFDFDAEMETLLLLAQRAAFGPSTQSLVDEAVSRDIPWMRLNSGSLVQLGQGVHQRRIRATMTSLTSNLAVDIASDKEMTIQLLGAAGLPVPRSVAVRGYDMALVEAHRLGYPVVVKPLDGNHGRGVGLDINDDEALGRAVVVAEGESRRGWILVENFLVGNDYRFLVVGGRMVAVAERVPAHVVGDGRSTIEALVAETNADPRRGVGHEKVLTRITVDEAAVAILRAQGFALTDVPPEGARVKLALTANMSTGGISIDRTMEAHPDNVEIAEEAARVVGLDVAGIDFIAEDITEPVREVGGGIVEVNAAPGFRMHTHPTVGEAQYVAKPVIDLLFPPGTPSRIPIVAITGTNGKTTTSRMVAHIFKGMGRKVGMTSTDGIVIDERLVIRSDASGPRSARMVLQNPRVDFAVFEVARGGLLREGLGYERNDVGVVLNIAADHLGLGGVDTVEQLAAVKRVVIEAVPRHGFGILNADDPLVAAMSRHCSGDVIWFSMSSAGSPAWEMIDAHCRRGGRGVVLEHSDLGDMIVIRHGRRAMQLAWTHLLPATFGGKAVMNVQNAMAAAAAAFAAGAPLHDIRQGLRTFTTSYYLAPGRLNMAEVDGVTVLVDYCHNAPGMRLLGDFIEKLTEPTGETIERQRRIGIIATAGDRRDEDMRELGEVAAPHFDHIIVREDAHLRGRAAGATAALVEEGVRKAMETGVRCRIVERVLPELDAVRRVLDLANPGDLVVMCVDQASSVWAEVEARSHRAQAGAREHPSGDPDL